MDISGVDLSATSAGMAGLLPGSEPLSKGGGDLLGLICPELGVAPLVDPGTDLEDERPTPVGGRGRVHASFSDIGRGLWTCHVLSWRWGSCRRW